MPEKKIQLLLTEKAIKNASGRKVFKFKYLVPMDEKIWRKLNKPEY